VRLHELGPHVEARQRERRLVAAPACGRVVGVQHVEAIGTAAAHPQPVLGVDQQRLEVDVVEAAAAVDDLTGPLRIAPLHLALVAARGDDDARLAAAVEQQLLGVRRHFHLAPAAAPGLDAAHRQVARLLALDAFDADDDHGVVVAACGHRVQAHEPGQQVRVGVARGDEHAGRADELPQIAAVGVDAEQALSAVGAPGAGERDRQVEHQPRVADPGHAADVGVLERRHHPRLHRLQLDDPELQPPVLAPRQESHPPPVGAQRGAGEHLAVEERRRRRQRAGALRARRGARPARATAPRRGTGGGRCGAWAAWMDRVDDAANEAANEAADEGADERTQSRAASDVPASRDAPAAGRRGSPAREVLHALAGPTGRPPRRLSRSGGADTLRASDPTPRHPLLHHAGRPAARDGAVRKRPAAGARGNLAHPCRARPRQPAHAPLDRRA
jgi:hypothetical protein